MIEALWWVLARAHHIIMAAAIIDLLVWGTLLGVWWWHRKGRPQ